MNKTMKILNSIGMFIWDFFAGIFIKLNLTERGNNKISLTNLAVAVCIVKIAITPVASLVDMGALLLSLLNYGHKRFESNKAAKTENVNTDLFNSIKNELNAISQKVKEQEVVIKDQSKAIEEQTKIVEEAKSALTAQKVATSLKPRQL